MFTPEEREHLRSTLIEIARADPRVVSGAITGSASVGKEDRWSDIDLAFGVQKESALLPVLDRFTSVMYRDHGALHHLDVLSGTWIYRVFLLQSTLQVDIAVAPESDFGPRAPTFKLLFGTATEGASVTSAVSWSSEAETTIGLAWLYALHVRSCIARGKAWQAEYMVSAMRDQVLALACLRHGLNTKQGRGFDQLPALTKNPIEQGLPRSLDLRELHRAFIVVMDSLTGEIQSVDPLLAHRLKPVLQELTQASP